MMDTYRFDDSEDAAELAELHRKFVVVPVDNLSNIVVFICKTHYIKYLLEELGMRTITGNPTKNFTALSKGEILQTTIRFWKRLEFRSLRKTLIYTGFLSCLRTHISRYIAGSYPKFND